MKNISEFFRTTSVNKLEFRESSLEALINVDEDGEIIHRSLRTAQDHTDTREFFYI